MKTIDKILTKAYSQMGRTNTFEFPKVVTSKNGRITKKHNKHLRIYDSAVQLDSGGYDKGGAYWGLGSQLRVKYNKDLSYINFYRMGEYNRHWHVTEQGKGNDLRP